MKYFFSALAFGLSASAGILHPRYPQSQTDLGAYGAYSTPTTPPVYYTSTDKDTSSSSPISVSSTSDKDQTTSSWSSSTTDKSPSSYSTTTPPPPPPTYSEKTETDTVTTTKTEEDTSKLVSGSSGLIRALADNFGLQQPLRRHRYSTRLSQQLRLQLIPSKRARVQSQVSSATLCCRQSKQNLSHFVMLYC